MATETDDTDDSTDSMTAAEAVAFLAHRTGQGLYTVDDIAEDIIRFGNHVTTEFAAEWSMWDADELPDEGTVNGEYGANALGRAIEDKMSTVREIRDAPNVVQGRPFDTVLSGSEASHILADAIGADVTTLSQTGAAGTGFAHDEQHEANVRAICEEFDTAPEDLPDEDDLPDID